MAVTPGLCVSGRVAMLRAMENDTFKLALYGADAMLTPLTDEYTSVGEVRGQGYKAGGVVLEDIMVDVDGVTAMMSWGKNPVWRNATISARGAMIYNASRRNAALAVLDFRKDVISTNGNWVFPFPPMRADTAIIRLT